MKKATIVLILLSCVLFTWGQRPADVLPNTVVIKVAPAYRSHCKADDIDLAIVQEAFRSLEVDRVSKRFPWMQPETTRHPGNPFEDRKVDLSTVYTVHYTSSTSPFKAAALLEGTGVLEYVEPWYVPRLIVTPNDQLIDSLWHLPIIKAFQAWDVDTGDADVVIAIVDTGVDKDHPDLVDALLSNEDEVPGNGIDDDNNGFIDDVLGWNFYNENNDVQETGFSHGTHVAGLAGASANNAYGMAGTGWSCKILPIKSGDKLTLPFGYDGIVYAAVNGADIINCSWGSFGASQFSLDVVRYATYNHDALLIGGAGNDNRQDAFYPASYQEVVSVGASDQNDGKSDFSNYNYLIDLIAPGSSIFSLKNDTFGYDSGTSMSAPIVAGAAGLIRSRFPSLSALQIREQLRVSADATIYDLPFNAAYESKLGTGRLDMYKAVDSIASPALRIEYHEVSDGDDEVFVEGEVVGLGIELVNFLLPLDDITVEVSSQSKYVEVLNGTWEVASLGENQRINNLVSPFELKVVNLDSFDIEALVKVTATSPNSSYRMEEYITFIVNPSYVNVKVNDITTTVTQNGLIGFTDLFQSHGLGFQLENLGNFVYEMGLMIGHEGHIREQVVDRVRGPELYDRDFWQDEVIHRSVPGGGEDYYASGSFTDSSATLDEIGLKVVQQVRAYADEGHRNYILMEYTIENRSGEDLSNMAVGLFADWDIKDATTNKAFTATGKRLGYVTNTGSDAFTGGIQALGRAPFNSYMIDNVPGGFGGIDMYDEEDYSSRRKLLSMTEPRLEAGAAGENGVGNDVIQVASMKGIDLKAGADTTLAFAIHAGRTPDEVLSSADSAYVRYFGSLPGEDVADGFELEPIWPNPTMGDIHLNLNVQSDREMEFHVYSSLGTLRQSYSTSTLYAGFNNVILSLPSLQTGVYYLEVKSEGRSEIVPFTYLAE